MSARWYCPECGHLMSLLPDRTYECPKCDRPRKTKNRHRED